MRRILAASLALTLAACGLSKSDEFRTGVPSSDAVQLKVPAAATSQQGLQGQTAEFYVFTRDITRVINGGTLLLLGIVKSIVEHEPTSIKANVATWGPWTDSLSPNTYKLVVTKNDDGTFKYELDGKGKTQDDSAYVAVLSGTHKVTGKDLGSGTMLIDWNAAQKLPEHDPNTVGTAAVTYSHEQAASDGTIQVAFRQVKDASTGQLIDADYAYVAHPANGGAFEFKIVKNMDTDPARSLNETMSVKSRWEETGTGRADIKATGGDLGTTVLTASQCWDSNFNATYLNVPWDPSQDYGTESMCGFGTAEYSALAL